MAARNESGADRKRGKERSLSKRSKGRPWMVEAVKGDGRMGLEGFVSDSKARMSDMGSGTVPPLTRLPWTAGLPALYLRMRRYGQLVVQSGGRDDD